MSLVPSSQAPDQNRMTLVSVRFPLVLLPSDKIILVVLLILPSGLGLCVCLSLPSEPPGKGEKVGLQEKVRMKGNPEVRGH